MKSKKEIFDRMFNGLEFISKCESDCSIKVPGLYCRNCTHLWDESTLLGWVLDINIREELLKVFKKSKGG